MGTFSLKADAFRRELIKRYLQGELIAVEGVNGYYIDPITMEGFSFKSARQLVNQGDANRPIYEMTKENGCRIAINACRVVWAEQNGVSLKDIGSEYVFHLDDDGHIAVDHMTNFMHSRKREKKTLYRKEFVARRHNEISLLLQYYNTGDISKVMDYAACHQKLICNMFVSITRLSHSLANELVIPAMDRYEEQLKKTDTTMLNICENIMGYMKRIYKERRKEVYYNDNKKR